MITFDKYRVKEKLLNLLGDRFDIKAEELNDLLDDLNDFNSEEFIEQNQKTDFDAKDRLNLVLKNANIAWWQAEIETQKLSFSDNLPDLFGYSISKFPNNLFDFIDLVYYEDRDIFRDSFLDVINENKSLNIEFRIKKSNGELSWFEIKSYPDKILDGKPSLILGTIADIDIIKKLKDNVETLETKVSTDMNSYEFGNKENFENLQHNFINLTESLPVGVYQTSLDGKIIFCNNKLIEILGYNFKTEIFEKNVYDFFVNPDDRQKQLNKWNKNEIASEIINLYRKDGKKIWVQDTGLKITDKSGNIIGFQGVIEDITSSKDIYEKLNQSNLRINKLIEKSECAIQINDEYGIVTEWNSAQENLTGISRDDVIGRLVWDIQDLKIAKYNRKIEDKNKFKNLVKDILATGKVPFENGIVVHNVDFNGSEHQIKQKLFTLKGDNNRYKLCVITSKPEINLQKAQPIIEAIKKNEEAKSLKRIINRNLNHVIRTPLNGILGLSKVISDEFEDEEYNLISKMIHINAEQLFNTINSIFSLIEYFDKSEENLQFEKIEINSYLFDYCSEKFEIIEEKDLILKINLSNKKLFSFINKNLLQVCLDNLFDNAIKFTEKGEIKLSVFQKSVDFISYLCIEIEDTGIGIDEKYYNKIFEPFYKIDNEYNELSAGVGLSIVKNSVEKMNGNISVQSKNGIGSKFTICIQEVTTPI